MIPEPYNLKSGGGLYPTLFYDTLSDFTDEVIVFGKQLLGTELNQFEAFLSTIQTKKLKTQEYLVEVLMMGVLYHYYSPYLSESHFGHKHLFDDLYLKRKKHPEQKEIVDSIRGKLANQLLLTEFNERIKINDRLSLLLVWLDCTKEFEQECRQLEVWNRYFGSIDNERLSEFWDKAIAFAVWFLRAAESRLGAFTQDWKAYRAKTSYDYLGREDEIFCSRRPGEYHLNMVAAEVMNRALRDSFQKAPRKILLLPTCMSKHNSECKAQKVEGNLVCSHCSSTCNVHLMSERMNNYQVDTVLIPHSTGFSKYLEPWKNSQDTALIGVACVLNLLKGGYEMQSLNIPSQCVFLDQCGCKKHWFSVKPTTLNEHQLFKLLQYESRKQPTYSVSG